MREWFDELSRMDPEYANQAAGGAGGAKDNTTNVNQHIPQNNAGGQPRVQPLNHIP